MNSVQKRNGHSIKGRREYKEADLNIRSIEWDSISYRKLEILRDCKKCPLHANDIVKQAQILMFKDV